MTRDRFQTRSLLLRTEQQRDLAIALLNNVPLDPEHPLECLVREAPKVRGPDANGYYWLRLGEIAEQGWFGEPKRQFNSDCWHEYAKRHLMQNEVTLKDGTVRSKWIESPDGTLTVISTTQLERGCFAEYTTIVEVFGAGIGVQFSVNPHGRG